VFFSLSFFSYYIIKKLIALSLIVYYIEKLNILYKDLELWSKNSYDSTDVNSGAGQQYGSDIHGVTIQTNRVIWDMIKILDREEMFGFYFTAKIAVKKTIVIMYHEDNMMLKRGKHLLREFKDIDNILFLAKIKKPKKSKNIKVWVFIFTLLSIVMGSAYFVYTNQEYFIKMKEAFFPTVIENVEENSTKLVEEIVEVDIQTLKVLHDNFIEQEKDPLQEKITKSMEMSVAVISSMVSEEEKAKYSSEDLVNNFKGKGGLKFELKKDENISNEEFNMSVKELNNYAMEFLKENNSSELLKGYDKVLKSDNGAKKSDVAIAHHEMGDLYIDVKEFEKAERAFLKSLKLSRVLAKEDPEIYTGCVALNLTKLSSIHEKSNKKKMAEKELDEAEEAYLKVLSIYRELDKKEPGKFQKNIGWSLNMLANFYYDKRKEFEKSIEYRAEAVDIYQKLAKKEPKIFDETLFKTLNSFAKSYSSLDKLKLARRYYNKSLALMESKIKEKNGEEYIVPVAMIYNSLAWIDLSQSKFKDAQKKLQKVLALSKLSTIKSKELISTNYAYWGYLSLLKNDTTKALDYYLKSFNLNRRFQSAKSYVNILIKKDKYLKAQEFFELMLKTYEEEEQRAKIWIMYGEFYLKIHPESGKEKLERALKIYDNISKDKNSKEYRELIELMDSNVTKNIR